MIKKRIVSGVLAIVLLMTILPAALAVDGPSISLSSGSVDPGGSVTLSVSVKDNPGMVTCKLYFYYDTDVFTVNPVKDIRIGSDYVGTGGVMANTIEAVKEMDRYDGAAGRDGALALWYSGSGTDMTYNGTLMTVTLHAASNAAPGTYEIGLGYSPKEVQNQMYEKLTPAVSGGTVQVNGTGSGSAIPAEPTTPQFTDIAGTWAEDYILRAADIGLVIGDGKGLYRPNDKMTRAEFVMILWRISGSPKPAGKASFTDLPDAWYQDAIAWAEENGVVNGMGGGKFAPRGNVTRQQVVTILHRLCGTPKGMEMMFASSYNALFTDSAKVHDWARDAVYWALYKEIYCGVGTADPGTTLDPLADADRSQIAVMTVRYLDKY